MRALMQRRGASQTPEREPVPTDQSRATSSLRAQLRNASYEEGASALAPSQGEQETVVDPLKERRANHAIQAAEHQRIAAAIQARSLDPGAIAGLQAYLATETDWDVQATGKYDLTTASFALMMSLKTGPQTAKRCAWSISIAKCVCAQDY